MIDWNILKDQDTREEASKEFEGQIKKKLVIKMVDDYLGNKFGSMISEIRKELKMDRALLVPNKDDPFAEGMVTDEQYVLGKLDLLVQRLPNMVRDEVIRVFQGQNSEGLSKYQEKKKELQSLYSAAKQNQNHEVCLAVFEKMEALEQQNEIEKLRQSEAVYTAVGGTPKPRPNKGILRGCAVDGTDGVGP